MGPFSVQFCARYVTSRVTRVTQTIKTCFFLSLMIRSVVNSLSLTQSLQVSGFDLRAPGITLQSPVYGANCSCVKKKHYLTVLT